MANFYGKNPKKYLSAILRPVVEKDFEAYKVEITRKKPKSPD